jgi:hypothetical protein
MLTVASAHAAGVTPIKADTFIDSVGVNYYVDAGTQPGLETGGLTYAQAFEDLQKLGVRHVRGVLWGNPPTYSMYNDLHASLGIKFDFAQGYQDPSTIPNLLAKYRNNLNPGVVEALEGVNEPDVFPPVSDTIAKDGVDAAAQMVFNFQQALYTGVKNDSVLHDVAVLAPPLSSNTALAQNLASRNIDQYVDFANAHPYPDAGSATNPAPPEVNSGRTGRIALARTTAPGKPLIATETNTTSGTNATDPDEGIYAPRVLLANFQDGCIRSDYYALVNYNDPFPPLFGARGQTNYTTPNPEAYAIMHMIGPGGVLYEPHAGAPTDLANLDFALSDAYDPQSNPNGVASQLFQKSDGAYRLALWRPNYWASNTSTPNVTLTLPAGVAGSDLTLYTYLDSPNMTVASLLGSTHANVPVGARVVFVGMVPEPTSLGVLGIASLLVLRRRRRA